METKKKQFNFRLTEQELSQVQRLAEQKGVSVSDYLRAYIRRNARKARIA